eukprot:CAMPEP_0202439214 /NCGR_PEP_ID=MMETSP1345-20130828/36040_1 /ASSEMBLY_ACC=CAM_ASM_000843 /TAXON_ID=342563 /ORGANISM="Fabrea Fabrea salina" /LENGTH=99 /DNA_ID=CAMNT_0049053735 /DNA_START=309 /DNA_END=608 /DNA_ORIENTATION=+
MKEVHLNPDKYTEDQFEGSLESFEFKEALKSLEVMIDSTIKLPENNQSSRVDSKQESSYSFKNIKEDLRATPAKPTPPREPFCDKNHKLVTPSKTSKKI